MDIKKHLLPVYTVQFPIELADQQQKIFWLPDEIKVEKDIQDLLTNFSDVEKHATITTLKLFSLYETNIGDEYWLGRFRKIFDGAEFHRMASVFGSFELAVHAPFYNKINELLHVNTPDFYMSFTKTPAMVERIKHIDAMVRDKDDLASLAGFSMIEGVVLYSSFAFLKHYQSQGKNKLMNIVRGINFSVRDEALHSKAGAMCFKYLKSLKSISEEKELELKEKILNHAKMIYEHEKEIIAVTFEKGKVDGITPTQVINFVESRINICLKDLGYEKMFDVKYNPVADWFYKGINDYQFNDFFSGVGNQYNRSWDESAFTW
jgi:ribonucleotide reductase beta subunit family protein with ferritin-like domain